MNKIYKLLIESPEIPKGSFAVFKDEYIAKTYYSHDTYYVFYPSDNIDNIKLRRGVVYKEIIENRPLVWELQEDKLDLRSPEAERMREESRATRFGFIPIKGEMVFLYGLNISRCERVMYDEAYMHEWSNGFIKRTRELGRLHGEKYARYFLTE